MANRAFYKLRPAESADLHTCISMVCTRRLCAGSEITRRQRDRETYSAKCPALCPIVSLGHFAPTRGVAFTCRLGILTQCGQELRLPGGHYATWPGKLWVKGIPGLRTAGPRAEEPRKDKEELELPLQRPQSPSPTATRPPPPTRAKSASSTLRRQQSAPSVRRLSHPLIDSLSWP